jgi:hypothetical protein
MDNTPTSSCSLDSFELTSAPALGGPLGEEGADGWMEFDMVAAVRLQPGRIDTVAQCPAGLAPAPC